MRPLVETTPAGLYCTAGGFYIDPWQPLPGSHAIITHAHSDHAKLGAEHYLTSRSGEQLLRVRLGAEASITPLDFGARRTIGDVTVSLHPAGHVLGSAMIRIEHQGEVWVLSGDYATIRHDAAEPMEPVKCHVFFTESTFALPIYRWKQQAEIAADLNAWWAANQREGRASVVFGYSLGKAQRLLAMLDASIGPIIVHGAILPFLPHYARSGVHLPAVLHADDPDAKKAGANAMIIAPPSADNSPWLRRFRDPATAFASGWMRIRGTRRRRSVDRGFVLSDHADWPGLLDTIRATGASRIGAMHGSTRPFSRWLREQGLDSFEVSTRYEGGEDDESLTATAGAHPPDSRLARDQADPELLIPDVPDNSTDRRTSHDPPQAGPESGT